MLDCKNQAENITALVDQVKAIVAQVDAVRVENEAHLDSMNVTGMLENASAYLISATVLLEYVRVKSEAEIEG